MRQTIVAAIVVLSCFLLHAQKLPKDPWVVGRAQDNGKDILLRIRSEVPAGVQESKYPNIIEVHWKYQPGPDGMPSSEVVGQIAQLEAALEPIEGDRVAYVAMIVTGSGERTWLWYVGDKNRFQEELNRLIPDHPFPITITAGGTEPTWETYHRIRARAH